MAALARPAVGTALVAPGHSPRAGQANAVVFPEALVAALAGVVVIAPGLAWVVSLLVGELPHLVQVRLDP